jgi:hypothetical protein
MKPQTDETDKERILALHEAICRCPKCKGTTDKLKLCAECTRRDTEIDAIQTGHAP